MAATTVPDVGTPMQYEVKAEYTKELICTATRRFWLRYIGLKHFLLFAALIILLAWLLYRGNADWITVALGTALSLMAVLYVALYFVYKKRSMAIFREMEQPVTVFRFDDEGVSTRSDLGASEIKWKLVKKVWAFPEVWLLFL